MTEPLLPLPTPGRILKEEFLDPLSLSQNQLARDLDVPPARINDIIHGRRAITADTALRLGKYFNMTPEFWLNLQQNYELRKARRETWPEVEPRVRQRQTA